MRIRRRPFASVVVRTRGRRPRNLEEALGCLEGQSDPDFEVIVVANDGSSDVVRRALEGSDRRFRRRVRVLPAKSGGRTPPLNAGLDAARGHYLAFLDDDDVVTGDWIESFHAGATQAPGLVVRAGSLTQFVRRQPDGGYTTVGEPFPEFGGPEFDLVDHLVNNRSPNFSWAVPLDRVRAAGVRFDESLPVLEDWDFLMRCALAFGVRSIGRITGTYHRWEEGETALHEHGAEGWEEVRRQIRGDLDALVGASGLVMRLAEFEARAADAHRAARDERVWNPPSRSVGGAR